MSSGPPPNGGPPMSPPPDGDYNRGTALNGIMWSLTTISITLFCTRIYARTAITRNLGFEDAIMGLALALTLSTSIFSTIATTYGIGRHMYYLQPYQVANAIKFQVVVNGPMGILGPLLPKLVVTLLLIKVLAPPAMARTYLWTINIIHWALSIVSTVLLFCQCTPVSAYWTQKGTCWNPNIALNTGLAQGAVGSFVDFALALYPIPALLKLNMKLEDRLGIIALMGLGTFAGAFAIARTTQLPKMNSRADITWQVAIVAICVVMELNIVFICACIPSVRPLWTRVLGSSTKKGSSGSHSNSRSRWWKNSASIGHNSDGYRVFSKTGKQTSSSKDPGSSQVALSRSEDFEEGIRVTRDIELRTTSGRMSDPSPFDR